MTRFRVWTAAALAAGLSLAAGVLAQPPNLLPLGGQPKKLIKVQPKVVPIQPARPQVVGAAELPVVPKSSAAFLSVKLSQVIDHPDLKAALDQVRKNPEALDGLTEIFGVAPREIDRVTLFWPAIDGRGPGDPVVVVTTREAYNEVRVLKTLRAEPVFSPDRGRGGHGHAPAFDVPKAGGHDFPPPPPPGLKGPPGLPGDPPIRRDNPDEDTVPIAATAPTEPLFYEVRGGAFELLFLVDERTLVFLTDGPRSQFNMVALFAQLLQRKQTGPLADAIGAAGNHTLAGGVSLAPLFREFERGMPRELAPYAALLAARTGTITGDLDRTAKFTVKLSFDDAAAAKRATPVFEEGLKALAEKAAGAAAEMKDSRRPGEAAMAPLFAAAAAGMKNAAVKAEGAAVVATAEVDAGPAAARAVADLMQSVTSRKKFVARSNNLKQIGLSLHSYHDVHGSLPQNVYGPKGEPLLSWRVHLLPYLEQDNLYKQFKMDEPWDGPNNKKLVESMPKVYEVLGREAPRGQTYFQAFLTPNPQRLLPKGEKQFVGRSWLVDGGKVRMSLAQIPDGTSNTIGIVEARTPVVWSKPDDLPFGEKLPPLGEERSDVFMVLLLDGSVRTLPTDIKPDTLRILVDGQDGMVIPGDVFDDRRRPGGNLLPPGGGGKAAEPPAVKNPDGPQGLGQLRRIEAERDEALASLAKERVALELQAKVADRTAQLFRAGAATREEVDRTQLALVQQKARVAERERIVAELEGRLKTLAGGPGKPDDATRPPDKK